MSRRKTGIPAISSFYLELAGLAKVKKCIASIAQARTDIHHRGFSPVHWPGTV
jgi:hypothetical protein